MSANQDIPSDAPPSYSDATGASSSRPNANTSRHDGQANNSHLDVPGKSHGSIPPHHRRSMEDENRPLPKGWVRTFDPTNSHQFFVDTTKDPPRSIWVHPYDDDEYLSTLSTEERERIEQESMGRGHPPSKADILAGDTDDEDDHHPTASSSAHHDQDLPPRVGGKGKGKQTFGRKLKDKLTGMTHEERAEERKRRAEEEQRMYEQHLRIRQAMSRAAQTGQPQLLGKDKDGKDLYIEPPSYAGGYGGAYPGGYNPYGSGGIYTTPNARYIRPSNPYNRPNGMGYGGGYGLPLALGGGLMGGMLLGDMAMGGFGGGGL